MHAGERNKAVIVSLFSRSGSEEKPTKFEIFVSKGFCELEVSAVTHTLALGNKILGLSAFEFRYVSDRPGVVSGSNNMLLRAEPAIADHGFADVMIVVGGCKGNFEPWIKRLRSMQRQSLPVVLLSDAATAYIQETNKPAGKVTTHWHDALMLTETGYHPNLTNNLAESSDGIVTAGGRSSTQELIIALISSFFDTPQLAEIGNRTLLQNIRSTNTEQPRGIGHNKGFFDGRITAAIHLMENNISDPLSMAELTEQLGVSTRQLERQFREVFNDTPARFYKRIRSKQARVMLQETLLPIIDVAVATGFGSSSTLAKAVKDEYGLTPAKMRERRTVDLINF
ncbi:helix-turn-helix domain-containing protein [Ascidiaceihabitans sp.]|nr:helix-turn-helix domain-containing protein [Ascidiaceihabitans sp.]MCO4840678.1 helix-turn-helix domain-containing protein [Paracoccaceae bacterium]MDA9135556.1 helix-turn-helix domain-containing protein [Ascidiaceihabitans sp.]MDB0037544.1 helix-turn-helix domain-containing protein [Ascidiaceihabitans sp.]